MDYEFSFEEADALLMRDWFYEDEDIDDLIWLLTEDVYYQVYEKRHEYPYRVSLALRMHEPIKTKAQDFTDEMMDDMFETEEIERITESKKERELFVPPPRPRSELDDMYDELTLKIEKLKKEFRSNRTNLPELQLQLDEIISKIEKEDKYWKEAQWVISSRNSLM